MDRLFIGQNIIRLNSVDSTNNYMQMLLGKAIISEGTVVIANEQHAGRGQRGNAWESEAGKNLTLSILLKPVFLAGKDQFYLNKVISLALKDLISSQIEDKELVSIKWPNDIYFKDKKIAGILIENTIRDRSIQQSVIGMGININQQQFRHNIPNPVSLRQITGKEFDLNILIDLLCGYIESKYLKLRAGAGLLDGAYLNSLYRFNKRHKYNYNGEEIYASIKDVTPEGLLELEKDNSEKILSNFKELRFIL